MFKCFLALFFLLNTHIHPAVTGPAFLNDEQSQYYFEPVTQSSSYWPTVSLFFNTRIRSLYGDQTKALKQIASGIDRACLILASHHNPLGLLLYKLNPTNEFAQYGVRSSLEVKTLALLNAENPKIKGKGLGKKLLEKCYSLALAKCASGVHLTVSEHSNVLGFYKKQGFDEKHTFKNKCGATEYLLFKPLVIPEE